jgi:flagellar FliL protein
MKNRGRSLILILIVVVVLGGGGGAFAFLKLKPHKKAKVPEVTFVVALADLTVNLADKGRSRFLTASLGIDLSGEKPEEVAKEREAQIRDAVIMVMSSYSYPQLLSDSGKKKLKEAIAEAVTQALEEDKTTVKEVLFTNFVMN